MNLIPVSWDKKDLLLGKQGENLARCIVFDVRAWLTEFPGASIQLLNRRSRDTAPYLIAARQEDGFLYWEVNMADTAYAGDGVCELVLLSGETIAKSRTWQTRVEKSLSEPGEETPEVSRSWVDEVLASAAEIQAYGDRVLSLATHYPLIGENGNWYVWDEETEAYVDTECPSCGAQGEQGERGEAGDDGAPGEKGDTGERGEKGESGLPDVSTTFNGTLANNVEYHLGTLQSLNILAFSPAETGKAGLWSVLFTAGNSITVSVPASVTWAVAVPTFEAGKTYWLSFISTGSGYLGVWSVSA